MAAYDDATRRLVHKTIKKVTHDIEQLRFNTAISAMMILARHLGTLKEAPYDAACALALLVSPFAPHLGARRSGSVLAIPLPLRPSRGQN